MKKKYCWMWGAGIFLLGLLYASQAAIGARQPVGLGITEIMYDVPGTDTGKEWIEIHNPGSKKIIMSSVGQSGGKYTLPYRTCVKADALLCSTSYAVYSQQSEVVIKPDENIIIASDEELFRKDYPTYAGQILESRFSLTNKTADNFAGIFQEYKDEAGNKQLVWEDKVIYSSSWGGAGNGKSIELSKDAESGESSWRESVSESGTPGQNYHFEEIKYATNVYINELLPDPGKGDEESIELVSREESETDLENWYLQDASGKKYFLPAQSIASDDYFVIPYSISKISLNNSGDTVVLFNPRGEEIDRVSYASGAASAAGAVGATGVAGSGQGKSYSRRPSGSWEWTTRVTLGSENQFDIPLDYARGLIITEILANPKGSDSGNEWVELKNAGTEAVNLQGWSLINKAKNKYSLPPQPVPVGQYAVVYLEEDFGVGNSGERLQLLDPRRQTVEEVALAGVAKQDVSYNRASDNSWRWSRFLTPGKKNKLNKKPRLKLKRVKEAYLNVPTEFDASLSKDRDKDTISFAWDFGDGGKSSSAKALHAYQKKGTYKVKLTISDGSEEVGKFFRLKVKDYPRKPIDIVTIMPDPGGKDTGGNELVTLHNGSQRELKLQGYMLYVGKDESSLRKYVLPEQRIPGRGQVQISNEVTKFSMPNEAGLVVLKYPDGQEADRVEYSAEMAIESAEGKEFVKKHGQWQWVNSGMSPAGEPGIIPAGEMDTAYVDRYNYPSKADSFHNSDAFPNQMSRESLVRLPLH